MITLLPAPLPLLVSAAARELSLTPLFLAHPLPSAWLAVEWEDGCSSWVNLSLAPHAATIRLESELSAILRTRTRPEMEEHWFPRLPSLPLGCPEHTSLSWRSQLDAP